MAYRGAVRRWDVFWVRFDPVMGSEQGGRRPAIVVSNDEANRRLPIVTVIPTTKFEGKRRHAYDFEVILPAGTIGSGVTTLVMPQQVHAVSKLRLVAPFTRIPNGFYRDKIETRLLEHLGIEYDTGI